MVFEWMYTLNLCIGVHMSNAHVQWLSGSGGQHNG